MSFILDALRKLEQERHQGATSGASSSSSSAFGARRSRRWTIGVMVAIAVGSGAVTAAVLRMAAPAAPPDFVEPGNDVEPASSSPQAAAATSESALVEPPAPRAEPRPTPREAAPPVEAADVSVPVEPAPKDETPQNIRLVGRDSPARGSTAASEAPAAPAEPAGSFPRLVLQGTSVIDGEPVAVISDRRVFEGDQIDGALVIRIGERVVELEFEGRRFTISL
jgi:hypothetical protein